MDITLTFLFVGAILAVVSSTGLHEPLDTANGKKSGANGDAQEDPSSEDRININVNRGHAAVHGAGGVSVSDSVSKGVQVGIRRPGMADQTLYQKSDSYGTSQAYGQRPPTAWTAANNQIANGVNGGGATAGFSGGQGVAQTESMSKTVEIPLDDYGTVLFTNLQEKQHDKPKDTSNHHNHISFRPEV